MQQLLAKIQSDPKMKADAARGIIRGPQLAQLELELRKLAYPKQGRDGQQGAGHRREEELAERQERTRALAEAVLHYYLQLGHMLSCAVDLR